MASARDMEFGGDFKKVIAFYDELRRELYKDVAQYFGRFRVTPITMSDCFTADAWSKIEPERRCDWSWVAAYNGYHSSFKRFDVAFKQSDKLVSLAYGQPTAHNTGLKVELIESTPFTADKLGIKGFEAVSYAAQVYAAMIGADEIRVMKPTSIESRSHYCSFGYEYVGNSHKPSQPDYCVLKLR